MYDCLLINPRSVYYSEADRSLPYLYAGILSIGSLLQARGWSTGILDMVVEKDPIQSLESCLHSNPNGVAFIGLSVMTSQITHALELSQYLKQTHPHIPVVWGGSIPRCTPRAF